MPLSLLKVGALSVRVQLGHFLISVAALISCHLLMWLQVLQEKCGMIAATFAALRHLSK
jgi:hypothetical protein